jgi:hypothetical protein
MFHINDQKLREVVFIVQNNKPEMSWNQIEGFILADWSEGEEHQEWLDHASPKELVDWVVQCN